MNKQVSKTALVAGAVVMLPLNSLISSPRNARKSAHSAESIEAKAASIAAKGILQNLVVEPELDPAELPTGKYLVTIGEGRRLAQRLRVERGEITETELIPCVIDTVNDPHEISLDENVTREDMHPADQFEAFRFLNEVRGLSAEDIAARFGVTARTVQQRLRLGAVSPRLMQAYRDEALSLDQLMAFCLTEDHARQEAVFDNLTSYQREPYHIRRLLTAKQVRADDRRACFVGAESYGNAGGHVERDLFTEDGDGYFTDAVLLDQIAVQRLTAIAVGIQNAEGWKWAEGHIDFPYSAAYRRAFPKTRELSEDDAAALATAQSGLMLLSDEWCEVEDLPDEIDARMTELEKTIADFNALTTGFDPDDIARGGIIVSLTSDGTPKVERGLIRLEDLKPDPQPEPEGDDGDVDGDDADERRVTPLNTAPAGDTEPEDLPLSDTLIRELTAQRTLALRLVMGEQPEFALRALAHSLVLQVFYNTAEGTCLEIDATNRDVSEFIDDVDNQPTAQAIQSRHDAWHSQMPDEPVDLWPYLMAMEPEDLGGLVAHCVSQIVDAVRYPYDRGYSVRLPADRLATGVALDMNEHWRPTARSYFGRITKARIVDGVREAVSLEAAERISALQKQPMAEAAEQLVAGTGWLPAILRTPPGPNPEEADTDQPDLLAEPEPEVLPEAAE